MKIGSLDFELGALYFELCTFLSRWIICLEQDYQKRAKLKAPSSKHQAQSSKL
jgi:hypothetical protein